MNISHSQLETFNACQYRWYLEKVRKVAQGPNTAFWLGTAFHEALEAFGQMSIAGERGNLDTVLIDALVGIACQQLATERSLHDPSNQYVDEFQWDTMTTQLDSMLTAFVEQIAPTYHPLAVEQQFSFAVDDAVQCLGYMDAITPHAIVDFKTASAKSFGRWIVDGADDKPQATAYLLAQDDRVAKGLDVVRPQKATFVVFGCDAASPHRVDVRLFPTRRSEEEKRLWLEEAAETAQVMRKIRADTVKPTHNPTILCRWCGVAGSCTVGRDFVQRNRWKMEVPLLTG